MAFTQRELAARRRMFRRRRAGVLLVIVLIVLAVVLVPRITAAAVAAGVRDDLNRLGEIADGAVAASASLVPSDASQALAEARAAGAAAESDAARADAAPALASAVETYRHSAVAAAKAVLGDWSDADKSTEDALYKAIKALDKAEPETLAKALAKTSAAADAVRASAQTYRDGIVAAADGASAQPTGGDVSAQQAYLLSHATDYNDAQWGDYNEAGGDCVNFASQGLLARGWTMDDEWYSGGPWKASKAWRDTAAMDDYLSAQGFSYATMDDLDHVRVGDVAVFDWGDDNPGLDHTMTVSHVTYSPKGPVITFASHNTDGADRPMPKVLSEPGSGASVKIYSIP